MIRNFPSGRRDFSCVSSTRIKPTFAMKGALRRRNNWKNPPSWSLWTTGSVSSTHPCPSTEHGWSGQVQLVCFPWASWSTLPMRMSSSHFIRWCSSIDAWCIIFLISKEPIRHTVKKADQQKFSASACLIIPGGMLLVGCATDRFLARVTLTEKSALDWIPATMDSTLTENLEVVETKKFSLANVYFL